MGPHKISLIKIKQVHFHLLSCAFHVSLENDFVKIITKKKLRIKWLNNRIYPRGAFLIDSLSLVKVTLKAAAMFGESNICFDYVLYWNRFSFYAIRCGSPFSNQTLRVLKIWLKFVNRNCFNWIHFSNVSNIFWI